MASLIARWISSGPPMTSPTARMEACTITVSPGTRPSARRSSASRRRAYMVALRRIEPRVVAGLVNVPLVMLVLMDADLRRVVRPSGGALDLAVEASDRRLRVGTPPSARPWALVHRRRHACQHLQPLLGAALHESLAGHLAREVVDGAEPIAPLLLLLRVQRIGEPAVDLAGDAGRARTGRDFVGRDDHVRQLVHHRELRGGEEAGCEGALRERGERA